MVTPIFRPTKPHRAFDDIVAQIREMVRDGQLRSGDRLPAERALAEQFAVSRNTVREALRMIEIAGLIQLRRGATGGAFIAEGDPGRVASNMSDMIRLGHMSFSDLTEARTWLESIVVRAACERADSEYIARLEANVAEAGQLSEAGDLREKANVHVEFHNILAEATGNPVLVAMMRSLMEVARELVHAVGPTEGDIVIRSRRRFLKHLRAGETEAAVEEMNRYLQRLHKLWVKAEYRGSRSLPQCATVSGVLVR